MKRIIPIILALLLTGLLFILAISPSGSLLQQDNDLPSEIQRQLSTGEAGHLSYPLSVTRFYAENALQPTWIKAQKEDGPTWQAMMLLDCLEQYGLPQNDQSFLTYNRLHKLLDTPGKAGIYEQVRFDILLTDAIITLINNLHYGKLNPAFQAIEIDKGANKGFEAIKILRQALQEKSYYAFYAAIEQVQPHSKMYKDLQNHLRLLTSTYDGGNYKYSESYLHIIAINLERLRWAETVDSSFLQANIPSYTLRFYQPDTMHQFKIAVGKSDHPTPTFNSKLTYFTTAPDIQVLPDVFRNQVLPQALRDRNYLDNNHLAIYNKNGSFIVTNDSILAVIAAHPGGYFARHASGCDKALGNLAFQFPNSFGISMHDLQKKEVFDLTERALSSGCIWIDRAEELATLLLIDEGRQKELKTLQKAVRNYQRETYVLKKPLPVRVTYLTCEIQQGRLIIYKDIYNLDKNLERELFPVHQDMAMRLP